MKRLHIHVGVESLEEGIRFYNALFGTAPVKTKPDYAKWMPEDLPVNFAISTRAGKTGVDHLGIQVDEASELAALREQVAVAEFTTRDDGETVCCYARSDKSWLRDPAGVAWEAYHTLEDAELMSEAKHACCTPAGPARDECCDAGERASECCAA